jgi:copper(I)-binding protein
MTNLTKRALLAAAMFAGLRLSAPALATDRAPATVRIEDAWCPPTPPGAPTAAGYLTIDNLGPDPDRLLGGSTPAAAQVQLHSMTMQGAVMRMRPVTGGLEIARRGTARIQPGDGLHLMLIGLKRPLRVGEHVAVTLDFARAGSVRADFVVRPSGGSAPAMDTTMHMGPHDHVGGQ